MKKISDYHFSTREKDGGIQLILAYKVGRKWYQKTKQGFRTKREAAAGKRALLLAAEKSAKIEKDSKDMTFEEFFNGPFLTEKKNLRPRSIAIYKSVLSNIPTIRRMRLSEIGYPQLVEDLSYMRNVKGLAPLSVSRALSTLHIVFSCAKKFGAIESNPTKDIRRLHSVKEKKRVRVFTEQELGAILNQMLERGVLYYCASVLSACNGLRIGEVLGLTWDNIDFERCEMSIKKQAYRSRLRSPTFVPPKTENSVRTIPISPRSLEALEKLLEMRKEDSRLFVVSTAPFRVALNREIQKVVPGATFHALRHTFATLMLYNGADVQTVAALLGDTPQTVMTTYIHYTDDLRRGAKNLIKNVFPT